MASRQDTSFQPELFEPPRPKVDARRVAAEANKPSVGAIDPPKPPRAERNLLAELAELKHEHAIDQERDQRARRTIREQGEEITRLRDQVAKLERTDDKERIHPAGASAAVEVTPRQIVGLEIDCGCMAHSAPRDFQLALTRAGGAYVRVGSQDQGTFRESAHGGPTYVRIVSVRNIEREETEP